MMTRNGWIAAVAATLVLMVAVTTASAAPNPAAAAAQRRAGQAVEQQMKQLEQRYADATEAVQKAVQAQLSAKQKLVDAREQLAKAYEAGEPDAIRSATEAVTLASQGDAYAGEVVSARSQVDRYNDEALMERYRESTRASAQAEFEAMLAAYNTAADKWEAVAVGVTPTASRESIEQLKDEALAAAYAYSVAQTAWSLENWISRYEERAEQYNSEKLNGVIKRMRANIEAQLEEMQKQHDAIIAVRKISRQRGDLNDAFNEAFAEARQ